jgi:hypothetical protein
MTRQFMLVKFKDDQAGKIKRDGFFVTTFERLLTDAQFPAKLLSYPIVLRWELNEETEYANWAHLVDHFTFKAIDVETAETLERLFPWGQGFARTAWEEARSYLISQLSDEEYAAYMFNESFN